MNITGKLKKKTANTMTVYGLSSDQALPLSHGQKKVMEAGPTTIIPPV